MTRSIEHGTHRKISRWRLGTAVILCLIGLSFILPNRVLRWWVIDGQYEKPQWSPDGNQILYLYHEGSSDQRLVVTNRNAIWPRLDLHGPILEEPSWRSDTEVSVFYNLFDLNVSYVPKLVLWLWNLDTGVQQTFDAPLPAVSGIAWSPDGSYALISFQDFESSSPKNVKPAIYKFTPHTGQFMVWREAEWPGAIRWSHDGRYVAYLDLISIGQEKQWELHIVDMHCETCNKTIRLTAFSTDNRLAWSPSGKWILLHQTRIENLSPSRSNHQTLTGFTFLAVDDPEYQAFWEDTENYHDLDWSVNGDEIIAITVPQPWVGFNKMHVIHVPEKFR